MSEKITFSELVEKISAKTDNSEQSTNDFIHELAGIIETSLGAGEKISISGFGKFELRWMDERKGRNPQTGEDITIPGQNKVVFKPYKDLRERVNRPFEGIESQVIGDEPKTIAPPKEAPVMSYSALDAVTGKKSSPSSEETVEDLIIERESPVKSKLKTKPEKIKPAYSKPDQPAEPSIDDDVLAWVFDQKLQHQDERVRDVQSNGRFKWSYAAAIIIVLLAIFLFIFMMNNKNEPQSQNGSAPQSQSNVTQVDKNTQNTAAGTESGNSDEQIEPVANSSPTAAPSPSVDESGMTPVRDVETTTHSVTNGESLWSIARNELGDPYLWPAIFYANKSDLNNPNILVAGNFLEVPVFSRSSTLSQKERKLVALGYISVYDWISENQPENARYYLWAAGSFSEEVLQNVSDSVKEADLAFATQG